VPPPTWAARQLSAQNGAVATCHPERMRPAALKSRLGLDLAYAAKNGAAPNGWWFFRQIIAFHGALHD
jgi:hypothetical protein